MDEQRIKEASQNVKSYLADGLLRKTQPNKSIIRILIRNSTESLHAANLLTEHSFLWTIVCAYYVMFYKALAV